MAPDDECSRRGTHPCESQTVEALGDLQFAVFAKDGRFNADSFILAGGRVAHTEASSSDRRVGLLLFRRDLEFGLDEMFDALSACQTQAHERALVLQVDVKIKKRAALAFGSGPIG